MADGEAPTQRARRGPIPYQDMWDEVEAMIGFRQRAREITTDTPTQIYLERRVEALKRLQNMIRVFELHEQAITRIARRGRGGALEPEPTPAPIEEMDDEPAAPGPGGPPADEPATGAGPVNERDVSRGGE